jgi:peptide-methionine (S)-S-oxide reductase
MEKKNLKTAVLGGGCFWCTEALLKRVKGVKTVTPGYSGGTKENPTYREVCTERTGHAEVVKIEYDPRTISYEALLRTFFEIHDPTTIDRQGRDVGSQYRSIILYQDEGQKKVAEKLIKELEDKKEFAGKIQTEVAPFKKFYKAEDYHQDYYNKNRSQPYCRLVIDPKIKKLLKGHSEETEK